MKNKKLKIGLALGSGGIKGYSHVGVLKVLEENNIPIAFISGSSIGAMIGSVYSYLKDSKKLEEIVLSTSWHQISSLMSFSFKEGLIKGEMIEKYIDEITWGVSFEDLKIPLSVVTTNFKTGESVNLSRGDVAKAVRASSSIPWIFKSVKINGKTLCDGGLSNPVPVDVVRKMGADIVIAVNLDNESYFDSRRYKEKNFYLNSLKSIQFLQYNLAKERLRSADIIIEPSVGGLGLIGLDSFIKQKGQKVILEGEKATSKVIKKIKKLLK